MEHDSQPEAYHIHVWIRGIHPMLWRRFLVRSDGNGNSEEGRIAPVLKCSRIRKYSLAGKLSLARLAAASNCPRSRLRQIFSHF